jgi:hypothetical protein
MCRLVPFLPKVSFALLRQFFVPAFLIGIFICNKVGALAGNPDFHQEEVIEVLSSVGDLPLCLVAEPLRCLATDTPGQGTHIQVCIFFAMQGGMAHLPQ